MIKHNLVIASVLKPVDDTRMYEKFGITFSSLPHYHVHIAGFASDSSISHPNISFHPLFNFPRLSVKRFLAPLKFYSFIHKVKPKVLIVCSPDLLIVSSVSKILFGYKLYYDVQENYYYNLLYTDVFRPPFKHLLALGLRAVEYITAPAIDHFLLAEKSYVHELPFIGKRYTVIENKYNPLYGPAPAVSHRGRHRLLYTGTIAASYGVFEAIKLAKELFEVDPRFSLTIIGYCAKAEDYILLMAVIKDLPFVRLIGGRTLVPHRRIIEAIQEADIGLICYRDNKSTRNRIPTKLYEYIYYHLPMIITDNPLWLEYCSRYNAAIPVDYLNIAPLAVIDSLNNTTFYSSALSVDEVVWSDEPRLLLDVLYRI